MVQARLPYEQSYMGQLRKLVGNRTIIALGARAIVRDAQGRILLVRRSDNGVWVMPAGSIELNESILDCLKREVWEETGLQVLEARPIAIYSEPRFAFTTAYGDHNQMFSVVFLIDKWQGTIATSTDETTNARFFAPDELPENVPDVYRETLADLQQYELTGMFVLK